MIYFLKNKYDVFDKFKRWKAMVENKTNLKVKCLHSDNGGQQVADNFKKHYTNNGIKIKKTILEPLQKNGIVERMNMTLNEHAISMRLLVGLPKMFLSKAVSSAAYLINRGSSTPFNCIILGEV